jgi:hypothetical protein
LQRCRISCRSMYRKRYRKERQRDLGQQLQKSIVIYIQNDVKSYSNLTECDRYAFVAGLNLLTAPVAISDVVHVGNTNSVARYYGAKQRSEISIAFAEFKWGARSTVKAHCN